jgi:hypothetical protein
MSDRTSRITIWFLCGIILSVYGLTIAVSGIYHMVNQPDVVGAELHLDFWWGLVLIVVGGIFLVYQRPGRIKTEE